MGNLSESRENAKRRDKATARFLKSTDGALIMKDLQRKFGTAISSDSVQQMARGVGNHDVLDYLKQNGERAYD